MTKQLLLPQDPRWIQLVERFAGDPAGFSMEVRGQTPSFQQMDLFSSVAVSSSRTSVASGHGCFGKGTEIALANHMLKPVEDVQAGDLLLGDDGISSREVLLLHQGRECLYRFVLSDGSAFVFNYSHTLCTYNLLDKKLYYPAVAEYVNDLKSFQSHVFYRKIWKNL